MSLQFDLRWGPPSNSKQGRTRGAPAGEGPTRGFSLEVACTLNQPVTGIFGPSGSGKTTLLSLIAGLLEPQAGRITHDDTLLFDSDSSANVPTHRRHIAVVFQDGRLFPHLSVSGNLRFGRNRSKATLRLDEVVEMLSLGNLLSRSVQQLSGGERQRVALGRALLSSPRLLLLDEPLASLDVGMKRQVLPMLRRVALTSRTPMLYVSHDISEILQLTQELLVLDAGRSIGQGRLHEVVRDPRVFRLASQTGLENVLRARIEEHLTESGLCRLRPIGLGAPADSPTLLGPPLDRPAGAEVMIAVRPEDIAVALTPIERISIQNQVRATIVQAGQVAGHGLLEVDIGAPLLVEVSLRAMAALDLKPGRSVCCLLKAHAIRYLDA